MTDAEWQDFARDESINDDCPIYNLDGPDFDYEYGVTTETLKEFWESARLALATPDEDDSDDSYQS